MSIFPPRARRSSINDALLYRNGPAVLGRRLKSFIFGRRLHAGDLRNFSFQFAAMSKAGIPVLESLYLLAEKAEKKILKDSLIKVARGVERGNSLADSLCEQKDVFPDLVVNVARSGEDRGVLPQVLQRLALHFEKQFELEQRIKAATVYPKIVAAVIFIVAIFLLSKVLPSFVLIFESMGVELPLLTRAVLEGARVIAVNWYLVLFIILVAVYSWRSITKTEKGSLARDKLLISLPLLGPIYCSVMAARFCRTLSTMLHSGAGILESLQLAQNVVENRFFHAGINAAREDIAGGCSLSRSFTNCSGLFPAVVISMVGVGEKTGSLVEVLSTAAEYLEAEADYTIKRFSSILEPVLILFLAAVVGGLVLSVMTPMFEIFEMVR